MFLVFSNHFDMLISKIIFNKWQNIIDIYFDTKNYLKNNHNYIPAKQKSHSRDSYFNMNCLCLTGQRDGSSLDLKKKKKLYKLP